MMIPNVEKTIDEHAGETSSDPKAGEKQEAKSDE
jgi:hypothetical protein